MNAQQQQLEWELIEATVKCLKPVVANLKTCGDEVKPLVDVFEGLISRFEELIEDGPLAHHDTLETGQE
jgi:hypothetical protein